MEQEANLIIGDRRFVCGFAGGGGVLSAVTEKGREARQAALWSPICEICEGPI